LDERATRVAEFERELQLKMKNGKQKRRKEGTTRYITRDFFFLYVFPGVLKNLQ
jgi:hypothetical protein